MHPLDVFIGYDKTEPVAYHTCCESIITNSSRPVRITPLYLPQIKLAMPSFQSDYPPSNGFVYSRFLVPYMMQNAGKAIYLDGDMVVEGDIAELFDMPMLNVGVAVVKHDYQTSAAVKYRNAVNRDYPRKNWSSVILWNCAWYPHRLLTPSLVAASTGEYLHRFGWLTDDAIGDLPKEWNVLAGEPGQTDKPPKLIHYTLGTPCFAQYEVGPMSARWHHYRNESTRCIEFS